jgi:hypothetical protein
MNNYLLLIRWLVVAGVADWLFARTITRVAIFIPMPPALASAFRLLDTVGQVAISLAGLLVLVVLGLIAWHEWSRRWGTWLVTCLIALVGLNFLFLFVPPAGWLALGNHLAYLALITMLVVRAAPWLGDSPSLSMAEWIALLIPALALVAARLHQALPALYAALHWPGPVPFTMWLFNFGEFLVILSVIALWWVYGRGAPRLAWLVAVLPALIFAALHLSNPAMNGILVVWSTGISLYLPWPFYALAICLAAVTLLSPRARLGGAGWAILLLAAGGYAPQLSVQAFLSLVALYLLTGAIRQQATEVTPEPIPTLPIMDTALPSTAATES